MDQKSNFLSGPMSRPPRNNCIKINSSNIFRKAKTTIKVVLSEQLEAQILLKLTTIEIESIDFESFVVVGTNCSVTTRFFGTNFKYVQFRRIFFLSCIIGIGF